MLVKHRHCFGASSESLEQSSDMSFFVFWSGVAFFSRWIRVDGLYRDFLALFCGLISSFQFALLEERARGQARNTQEALLIATNREFFGGPPSAS